MKTKDKNGRMDFRFYKQYALTYFDLETPEEKADFMDALLLKQFYNVEIPLKGLARFAFNSQKIWMQNQIDGYLNKGEIFTPYEGGIEGAVQGAMQGAKAEIKKEIKKEIKTETKYPSYDEFLNHAMSHLDWKDGMQKALERKYKDWIDQGWQKIQDGQLVPILIWKTTLNHTIQYLEVSNNSTSLNAVY